MTSHLLLLPSTPQEKLPLSLQHSQTSLPDFTAIGHHYPALIDYLSTLQINPTMIIGSFETPVLFWSAARRVFPEAIALCYENEGQSIWRDLMTTDAWQDSMTKTDVTEVDITKADINTAETSPPIETKKNTQSEIKAVEQKQAKPHYDKHSSLSKLTDGKLLFEILCTASWDGINNERQLEPLMQEIIKRQERSPELYKRAQQKKQQGQKAKQLNRQIDEQIKQQHKQHRLDKNKLIKYVQQFGDYHNKAIQQQVKHHINKQIRFYENKRQNRLANKQMGRKHSSVHPPKFINGTHPNNLRHLKASGQWQIIIDETGQCFAPSANTLSIRNKELGRVVALAIPQYSWEKLPPLDKHHATTATDQKNDEIMTHLLSNPVGIFGFTVIDDALTIKSRWISAISQLVRWLMLLLPIDPNGSSIEFHIEQRDYNAGYPLNLWAESLESELLEIDSKRFKNCRIKLQFITKEGSPYNGYVDTIAHTWGSQTQMVKSRLKKSMLERHCLLRPEIHAIERLYLAINARRQLSAEQWYDVCGLLAKEPESSLLHNFMADIGHHVQQDKQLWQHYMDRINQVLQNKSYQLSTLGAALDWLMQYKPNKGAISPLAQLHWLSAKLAHSNHLGQVEKDDIKHALALSQQLKDESAVDACHLCLRIAITCSNNFEFDIAQQVINSWQNEVIAIPGLVNYAKLQSTTGQLLAFQQKPKEAIQYFDQAIHYFKQVSDPHQAQKDIQQCSTYKLIAIMDDCNNGEEFYPLFWQTMGVNDLTKTLTSTRKFACLNDPLDRSSAYQHHLLLRAFVYFPQAFKKEIQSYLDNKDQWLINENHPWEWISAYRGWLLSMNGQQKSAQAQFEWAIEHCLADKKNITIQWLGQVITVLANKLQLNVDQTALNPLNQKLLQDYLNHAPHNKLSHWIKDESNSQHSQLITELKNCSPFNFH